MQNEPSNPMRLANHRPENPTGTPEAAALQGEAVVQFFNREFPELVAFSKILETQKGKSGRSREGYHAYEHGLEVTYLFYLVLKKMGYSRDDLRLGSVAASLHDFDIRPRKTAPAVARTFEQIDAFQPLQDALREANVPLADVKLLIYRTDFPWTDAHREQLEKRLSERTPERREKLRKMAEILQLIDKSGAALSLSPEGYQERVHKGLYDEEWHQNVPPEQYRAMSLAFFKTFLTGDPLFAEILANLPLWARENWRRLNEDLRHPPGQT